VDKEEQYMRRISLLAVLSLALAASCLAQGIPQGSYQQTCNNVAVNGAVLVANCQDNRGHWRNAQLPAFQSCGGDIVNDNGSLRCGGGNYGTSSPYPGGYQGVNGPSGSYLQSCRDIAPRGDDLHARCQTRDGNWRETSLDDYQKCRGDIMNDDGKLRCVAGGAYGGPVYGNGNVQGGSFVQSCQDIRYNGDDLHARCQGRDGGWRETKLDDYRKCRGDIVNDDGKLRCVAGGSYGVGSYGSPESRNVNGPSGSYLGSCRDVHVGGDDLHARCQTRDGGWHDTGLDDYRKCRGDIINDDGNLRCAK
jgi:CVNH domain